MKFNQKTIALASGLAVLTAVASPVLAQSTAEMLQTAEAACIEHAAEEGYDPNLAEVVSSRAVDADKVEVVLNLTNDGQNFARLTCPYSVSSGVGKMVGEEMKKVAADTVDAVGGAMDTVATPAPGLGRLWWLLVPLIGLP
ncbi:MAG TPA: hypothetical protein IGR64_09210, partial [Leptolyngbyaceae cyanobacterium M65_K2018_010]|nr:hypothetical protein [Leptolyngbyaceae cyanobacterium M65_K2018_010]